MRCNARFTRSVCYVLQRQDYEGWHTCLRLTRVRPVIATDSHFSEENPFCFACVVLITSGRGGRCLPVITAAFITGGESVRATAGKRYVATPSAVVQEVIWDWILGNRSNTRSQWTLHATFWGGFPDIFPAVFNTLFYLMFQPCMCRHCAASRG